MKLVIDRKTWRRGGNKYTLTFQFGWTHLLNGLGYKCCLGQIATQCGVADSDILWKDAPKNVPDKYTNYHSLLSKNDDLMYKAMIVNDDPYLPDYEREEKLIKLFAEHGHELEFVQ